MGASIYGTAAYQFHLTPHEVTDIPHVQDAGRAVEPRWNVEEIQTPIY